mmetsp:Transcript_45695/g.99189  ORF Transcript_45695/g.99189 Transcript_45695/m.99189 type:complete len:279 (+) Transcript_45695:809-1645(+)
MKGEACADKLQLRACCSHNISGGSEDAHFPDTWRAFNGHHFDVDTQLILNFGNVGPSSTNHHSNERFVNDELLNDRITHARLPLLNDLQSLLPSHVKLLHVTLMLEMYIQKQLGTGYFRCATHKTNKSLVAFAFDADEENTRLGLHLGQAPLGIIRRNPVSKNNLDLEQLLPNACGKQRSLRAHRTKRLTIKHDRMVSPCGFQLDVKKMGPRLTYPPLHPTDGALIVLHQTFHNVIRAGRPIYLWRELGRLPDAITLVAVRAPPLKMDQRLAVAGETN